MTAEFPTVYAAHFLVEARDRGQKIPAEVLDVAQRLADAVRVDAGEHACRRAAARVRRVSAGAAGHQAERGGLERRAGADAALSAGLADRSCRGVSGVDLPADAAKRRCRPHRREACPGRRRSATSARRSTTTRSCTTRSCCICSRGTFPNRLGATPPAALETMQRGGQRQIRRNSLSAAYTLLALDAVREDVDGQPAKLGITEIGKDGRSRALALPAGAMPKVRDLGDGGQAAVLARTGRSARTTSSTSRIRSQSADGGDEQGHRDLPRVRRREGQTGDARDRRSGVLRAPAACARHSAIACRRSRSSICCPAASSRCSSCSRRPIRARPVTIRRSRDSERRRPRCRSA